MKKIKVDLGERSYDIVIGHDLLKKCGGLLKRLRIGKDAVIITNRHLLNLYEKPLRASLEENGLTVRFEIVPDSEKAKSAGIVTKVIDRISCYDTRRKIFIVAFGGGVVGDLAGFVAAVYKRGIPYAQIPTTLLAQVDSAIGGKVAIDLTIAKNLIGAFYQPKIVISDVSLTKSLPARQLRNGLAEVIKYGVIKDKRLFSFLENSYRKILRLDRHALEYVISRSSTIKARIVEKDEFDKKGLRAVLNYGHTIGHAIEAASGYTGLYNHGEAIAIGMVIAAKISSLLGIMPGEDALRIEALVEKAGLPVKVKGLDLSRVYNAHLHDKKFINRRNRFILPTSIGRVKVVEGVPDTLIRKVINEHSC